ncbi:hypothetical protein DFH09DRAFT_1311765 [Mycena vulgaris]|nr:hypothetical protein DFH09DRAFT_1311765 [Mycena vulgaris]
MFILLHAAVAARRRLALPLSAKPISVQVQEKSALKTSPKPASSWPPLSLSWETSPCPRRPLRPLPRSSAQAPSAAPSPPSHPAPASRHPIRLSPMYESQTPVSMAKMIMNRHVRICFLLVLRSFLPSSPWDPLPLFRYSHPSPLIAPRSASVSYA